MTGKRWIVSQEDGYRLFWWYWQAKACFESLDVSVEKPACLCKRLPDNAIEVLRTRPF